MRDAIKRRTTCRVTLPDDLAVEVFLRLPARSLARLRCVCRSWNAEISSLGFQQRHHALAATKLAFFQLRPSHKEGLFLLVEPDRAANCKNNCAKIVGCKPCYGLVLIKRNCVGDVGRGYSVCNPTTNEILHLPVSNHTHQVAGMGFHEPSGEFKVVQVHMEFGKVNARVLTVGDARGWRFPAATGNKPVSFDVFTEHTRFDQHVEPVFADGCLHWSFKTHHMYIDEPHGILSFSLADESFRRAPQPPFSTADLLNFSHMDYRHLKRILESCYGLSQSGRRVYVPVGQTLAELDGRLCMVRDVRRHDDVSSLFQIWKLHEYDTGDWSLDYCVDFMPYMT